MEVSFYLKEANSKQETSIYARICYEGYKLKYYPSEKINPKFWNKTTQRAKQTASFKEYPEFNQRLEDIASNVRTVYRNYLKDHKNEIPETETLKTLLDKELKKKVSEKDKVKTLFGFFEDLITQTERGGRVQPNTGKPYSKATMQVYKNTLQRLRDYQSTKRRTIDFKTIDLDFYTDFIEYLSKRLKLATNTIGKDIKTLKTVLNEATERGINTNLQFKSRRFSTTSEQTDSIYLTEKELKEIENLDLKENSRLDNVRDLFLIGCYTGLRYSDFSILTPEQIKDGFIEIKEQTKTGNPVVIPVHATVKRILKKYRGELPNSISNQKTNNYLKEIGKQIPSLKTAFSRTITKGGLKVSENFEKWELLSTHTARRSFATNEYLNDTPSITIMAITGHKTERAFMRYIKLTPNEHAKLLKLHWDKRNKLVAVKSVYEL
jgi:integrase